MTALDTVSKLLEVNPSWLFALIQFESAGNPAARNKITGARGLIQFMPATARELGFKDADDLVNKYPDFESQLLNPVYKYLKKYKPFPTKQSLYMSVFYPVARSWTPQSYFPAIVRKQNPNIDTVQDYINFVEKRYTTKKIKSGGALLLIAGLIFVLYKIATKGS